MFKRRRFKQHLSLSDRLKIISDQLKSEASKLKPSPERDALLRRARVADTASNIDQWTTLRGFRPPQ